MQETLNDRISDLQHGKPPKHVVFSTVLDGSLFDQDAPAYDVTTGAYYAHLPDKTPRRPSGHTFNHIPTLVKTPWEQRRPVNRWSWPLKRPAQRWSPRRPPRSFDRMPDEVYDLLIKAVDDSNRTSAGVCADCLLNDLYNLSLVGRAWHKAASRHLYRTLWVPLCPNPSRLHRRSRVKLLMRTLQQRPYLASQVQCIHAVVRHVDTQPDQQRRSIISELAPVVAECPNITALKGIYPVYPTGSSPHELTSLLALKSNLREYMWLLGGCDYSPQSLYPEIRLTNEWKRLEMLVIQDTDSLLGQGSMYTILRQLPTLQHLALVNLTSSAFHDGTLQALQGLRSLRLEALGGVTDSGLEQILPKLAKSLQRLSLIDLDIKSLRTLSNILANFDRLLEFTIVQDRPPGLPLGADIKMVKGLPLLSSTSVDYLHWEMLIPGSADQALEMSIRHGGFPALRSLRAPCDHDGVFQSLCRPIRKRPVSSAESQAYMRRDVEGYTRDLDHARTAAQVRTRRFSKSHPVSVVVQEEGDVENSQVLTFGRYLGDISSEIVYNLEPDFEGTKQALGRVDDVMSSSNSSCSSGRKGSNRHVVVNIRELKSLF